MDMHHIVDHYWAFSTVLLAVLLGSTKRTRSLTKRYIQAHTRRLWRILVSLNVGTILYFGIRRGIPLHLLGEILALRKWLIKSGFRGRKTNRATARRLNRTVALYRKMPLKSISRLWGKVNHWDLPVWLRGPLLGLYVRMFGCNLAEAACEDLHEYKNLGDFFRRQLKPQARPVDPAHLLTSPADGRVLHYGRVENGVLEQVKGVTYDLQAFLGPITWNIEQASSKAFISNHTAEEYTLSEIAPLPHAEYERRLDLRAGHCLHHCVVYLAPGDYHRFHSPVHWNVKFRRHFPGELLSVSPELPVGFRACSTLTSGRYTPDSGNTASFQWQQSVLRNVGSIKIYADDDLNTNTSTTYPESIYFDKSMVDGNTPGIQVDKGDMFGEFNLGSTIVLVFEAPKSFLFKIECGQKIKVGEPIGTC